MRMMACQIHSFAKRQAGRIDAAIGKKEGRNRGREGGCLNDVLKTAPLNVL
jgi:hypothetical protein